MTVRIFGEADAATLARAERCAIEAEAEAMLLMADNHKGYGMPVGGVAVYKDKVSPAGVGFDIACGNKAVRTDLRLGDIEGRLSTLADEIFASLSFGVGRKNATPVVHRVFDDPACRTWRNNKARFARQLAPEFAALDIGPLSSRGTIAPARE